MDEKVLVTPRQGVDVSAVVAIAIEPNDDAAFAELALDPVLKSGGDRRSSG